MKKLILLVVLVICSIDVIGQVYEIPKRYYIFSTMNLYCCGRYKIGTDDYYHYESYFPSRRMTTEEYTATSKGNERFFCFSKDAKRYYFYTDNIIGFYNPSDNERDKELLKAMKKYKVRNIALNELPAILNEIIKQMDEINKNANDSIRERKNLRREQQIRDSIAAAQKKEAERGDYRMNHSWHDLNMPKGYILNCKFCGISHFQKKYKVMSISADTLYYLLEVPDLSILGINHYAIHYSALTDSFKKDPNFIEYVNTWRDSLANHNNTKNQDAAIINLLQYNEFKQEICKVAPNGYMESWGWHLNTADGIEPHFTYYNTSKKTIKYIDFYFSVFNAVGDRCFLKYVKSYIGNVRGVGPVEPFESGSWSWSRATHYTSADASEMRIVKLVITYMDGTTRTIPRESILYANE